MCNRICFCRVISFLVSGRRGRDKFALNMLKQSREKDMDKNRLESFSDGLFAVVITIMVLELTAPHGTTVASLAPLVPIFLSYVLSFVYGAIFWVKHHHLMAITQRINNAVLWANLNFLFWISLVPFFTAWVDENHMAPVPVAAYGLSLFMVVAAYRILEIAIMRAHTPDSAVVRVLRRGRREKLSLVALGLSIPLSFVHPMLAMTIYIGVAIAWMMTKRAMRRALMSQNGSDEE